MIERPAMKPPAHAWAFRWFVAAGSAFVICASGSIIWTMVQPIVDTGRPPEHPGAFGTVVSSCLIISWFMLRMIMFMGDPLSIAPPRLQATAPATVSAPPVAPTVPAARPRPKPKLVPILKVKQGAPLKPKVITKIVEKPVFKTRIEYRVKPPEQEETDVYRLYDADGHLLYIGIGARAQDRWRQHAIDKPWWHEVARQRTRRYPFRYQALAVEESAIKFEQPKYNIRPGGLTDHASDAGWHAPRHVDGVLPPPRAAKPLQDAGLPAQRHDEPSSPS